MSNKKDYVVGGIAALAVGISSVIGYNTIKSNMEAHGKLGAQNSAQITQNSVDIAQLDRNVRDLNGEVNELQRDASTERFYLSSEAFDCDGTVPVMGSSNYLFETNSANPNWEQNLINRVANSCDRRNPNDRLEARLNNDDTWSITGISYTPMLSRVEDDGVPTSVYIGPENNPQYRTETRNSEENTVVTQINSENRVAPLAEGECTPAELRNITDSIRVGDEHGNHLGDVSRKGYLDGTPESFGEYITEEILDNFLDSNYNTADISMVNSEGREVTYTIGDSRSNSGFIEFANSEIRDNCISDVGLEAKLDNHSHISSQRVRSQPQRQTVPSHSHAPTTQSTSYTPTTTTPESKGTDNNHSNHSKKPQNTPAGSNQNPANQFMTTNEREGSCPATGGCYVVGEPDNNNNIKKQEPGFDFVE